MNERTSNGSGGFGQQLVVSWQGSPGLFLHLRQEAADEAQALPLGSRPRRWPHLLLPRGGRSGGGVGGGRARGTVPVRRQGRRRIRWRRRGLEHPDVLARDVDGAVGVTGRPIAVVDDLVASMDGRHDHPSEPQHESLPSLQRRGPRADTNLSAGSDVVVGAEGGRARGPDRG